MKREILFRGFHECENGKQIVVVNGKEYKGEWVEGNVIKIYSEYLQREVMAIVKQGAREDMYEGLSYEEVDPETVGQWTGLTDKNEKKIFEGDILKRRLSETVKVSTSKHGWRLIDEKTKKTATAMYINFYKVIGTIFDKED